MEITSQDQRVLERLGLGNISDSEKRAVLDIVDQRLEKRFIANLLTSLPEDKRRELEKMVETMEETDFNKTIEATIQLHPNAKEILERSAEEIISEFKQDGAVAGKQPTDRPTTPHAQAEYYQPSSGSSANSATGEASNKEEPVQDQKKPPVNLPPDQTAFAKPDKQEQDTAQGPVSPSVQPPQPPKSAPPSDQATQPDPPAKQGGPTPPAQP